MSKWVGQDYFWIAVAVPSLLAFWAVISTWPKASIEFKPWACSVILTTIMVIPQIQSYLHLFNQNPFNIYALPVFLVVYIVWGHYEFPSVRLAFAGTFLSLLIADIVGAWFMSRSMAPSEDPFFLFVGGAGIFDGLVLISTGAALLIAAIKIILQSGHDLSFLLGRKKYLSQR